MNKTLNLVCLLAACVVLGFVLVAPEALSVLVAPDVAAGSAGAVFGCHSAVAAIHSVLAGGLAGAYWCLVMRVEAPTPVFPGLVWETFWLVVEWYHGSL